jgi:hypothetical protein
VDRVKKKILLFLIVAVIEVTVTKIFLILLTIVSLQ